MQYISSLFTGLFCLYSLFCAPGLAQQITIRGFITDRNSNTALVGANITLLDSTATLRGAVSSADGYYIITQIPPGRYVLRASYIGYATQTDTLQLGQEPLTTYHISLEPGQMLDEIIIQQQGGAAELQGGLQRIRPYDLERIPTPGPGGDLATYLQTLPGFVALGDRGGQLYIRGGTPYQNLVLLDGTLIYQPFHIIGFFSAFPQNLVSNVDVFAGGFGARYTGRLSSVIDVTTRAGNSKKFSGSAAIGPFISSIQLEGPIRKDALSFLASMRSSLIEETAPFLTNQSIPLTFNDIFFKVQQSGRINNRCSLTGIHTYDRGQIGDEVERPEVFRWTNYVLAGQCSGFSPGSSVFIETNSGFSYVSNSVGNTMSPERSANAWLFNADVHWTYPTGKHEIQGGFNLQVEGSGYELDEQFNGIRDAQEYQVGTGAYMSLGLSPSKNLDIQPGLALTYPLSYTPSLEPRIRMNWHPESRLQHHISLAAGIYRQTFEGISDERDVGSLFTAWLPTPIDNKRSQALHTILGWQGKTGPFTLSAEGYYKRLRNVPVPEWSVIARFTTSLVPANGEVFGLDARIEMDRPPFYAYLGYGLSSTEYTTAQDNFGLWFDTPIQSYRPPHDRRHQLNALFSYDATAFEASIRWTYGSGLPYTQSLGTDSFIRLINLPDIRDIYGNPRFLFDRPYQGRLPSYHRLDASLTYTFALQSVIIKLQGGTINAYDRRNLFYFDLFTFQQVNQLAFFPYLSLHLEIP